jgi:hypothetical protein
MPFPWAVVAASVALALVVWGAVATDEATTGRPAGRRPRLPLARPHRRARVARRPALAPVRRLRPRDPGLGSADVKGRL